MSTLTVKELAAPSGFDLKLASGETLDLKTNGTLTMPAGHIIQVVGASTTTRTDISTTGSWVSVSLSASITPLSTSNKILIQVCSSQYADTDDQTAATTVFRDSTNLGDSTNGLAPFYVNGLSGSEDLQVPTSISYLDSPSSTSSITYEVKCRTDKNTYRFNGLRTAVATITLMEVAG